MGAPAQRVPHGGNGGAPESSASPAETCWDRAAPARRLRARQHPGLEGLGWDIGALERRCGLGALWQRECGCGNHAESIPIY